MKTFILFCLLMMSAFCAKAQYTNAAPVGISTIPNITNWNAFYLTNSLTNINGTYVQNVSNIFEFDYSGTNGLSGQVGALGLVVSNIPGTSTLWSVLTVASNTPSTFGITAFSGSIANNETINVAGQTYTWKTTLTPSANQVLIGSILTTSLTNLVHAVNADGNACYGTGTVANTGAVGFIVVGSQTTVFFQSVAGGAAANSNTVTYTGANVTGLSWSAPYGFTSGTPFLASGVAVNFAGGSAQSSQGAYYVCTNWPGNFSNQVTGASYATRGKTANGFIVPISTDGALVTGSYTGDGFWTNTVISNSVYSTAPPTPNPNP